MKELEITEIKCLDKGFVRYIDSMGGDDSIVQAARVSYGKGTKTVSEDKNLIRYLVRNKHTSPLEMVELQFHIKMPIFVMRQWIRHRTANVNEISFRYSEATDDFFLPELEEIRTQSETNKQGSGDSLDFDVSTELQSYMKEEQDDAYKQYQYYLGQGVAREMARINLPVSIYTECYWKIDLHNLFHFLKLRMDKHAQKEIRVFAEALYEITKQIAPVACKAFEDYILNAKSFSAEEMDVMKKILYDNKVSNEDVDKHLEDSDLSKREIDEFRGKIGI